MKEISSVASDLIQRDLAHLLHPYLQMDEANDFPLIPIKKGDGVWLEDYNGNKYLDAISSWWVNLFGHSNQTINNAIITQAQKLAYVPLSDFSHQPVIFLSEQLVQITPEPLQKCFYTDSARSAIQTALAMSLGYWANTGQGRKNKFVVIENSGFDKLVSTLPLQGMQQNNYGSVSKPGVITIPGKESFVPPAHSGPEDYAMQNFAYTEQILSKKHEEIAAVIIEPLVQSADAMQMYNAKYLALLKEACNNFKIHLIADETTVGFGRAGTMFACEQAGITPDFLCLSGGLTGGHLPLSVMLTSNEIQHVFYGNSGTMPHFHYSNAHAANPLACAAALATLELFRSQDIIQRNKSLIRCIGENGSRFADHRRISQPRQTGMIFAMDMMEDKQPGELTSARMRQRALRVYQHALKNHIWLRPLGNTICFMPPYIIENGQVDMVFDVIEEAVNTAYCD